MSFPSQVKPFIYAVAAAAVIGLVSSVAGVIGVIKDANQYERDLTMRDAAAVY